MRQGAIGWGVASLLVIGAPGARADLQEQRSLMRRVIQQQQAQLEQRLRCFNQASTEAELERCAPSWGHSWHHGRGMGGWGCPIW